MGRRGSLYVVGFTAKHWQNKALKKNKKTQAAQTDPGSRRASAASTTERRGSSTYGTGQNGSSKDSSNGTNSGVYLSAEKASQLDSQLTASHGVETTTGANEIDSQNGLRGTSDGSLTDERNGKSTQTHVKS